MSQSTLKMWLETARPKTLPLALASILTGSALAYWQGTFSGLIMGLCLLTTLLLQILSNFANDYGDHLKGSDTEERIGPLRGIQKGGISFHQLRQGLILMVLASLLSGGLLIAVSYKHLSDILVFAGLGALAIISAITYTVGEKPYGYMGLGDISVLIFFGLLAVVGSYYLQVHQFNGAILLPACASGLLAVAVLNINNLRDIEQDRKVGKNTLVVRLGAEKGRLYHLGLLSLAILFNLIFATVYIQRWQGFLFLIAIPWLVKHGYFVYRHKDPLALRPMLAQMSMLALLTNLLFSLGLLLA